MNNKQTTLSKAIDASKSNGEIKFSSAKNIEELRKYFEKKKHTDSFNKAILDSLN